MVPLCALSQAAFIADLGQLEVKNNFLYAAHAYKGIKDVDGELFVRASGEKAILDRIVISLSSIQVGRCVVWWCRGALYVCGLNFLDLQLHTVKLRTLTIYYLFHFYDVELRV